MTIGAGGKSTTTAPAPSGRCARRKDQAPLAFLNEARGRKDTASDGVAACRLAHPVLLLQDLASRAEAPQPAREQELTGAKAGAR